MYNVIDFIKPQIFNQRVISPYTKYTSNELTICEILDTRAKACDGTDNHYEGVCICSERGRRTQKRSHFIDKLVINRSITVMIQLPKYSSYVILDQIPFTIFKKTAETYITHIQLYNMLLESPNLISSHISLVLNNIKSGKYNENNNI